MTPARRERKTVPKGTLNEARWNEVLRAAAAVFAEHGYQAANISDIAARLGILKGSLYYYIESKEDLLLELMRRSHARGHEYIAEDDDTSALDAPARLEALIRRWMCGLREHPTEVQIDQHDIQYLSAEGREEIVAMRRHMTEFAHALIAQGQIDGTFSSQHDARVAATTLFQILVGAETARRRNEEQWAALTDWYVHLFLGSLSTDVVRHDLLGID